MRWKLATALPGLGPVVVLALGGLFMSASDDPFDPGPASRVPRVGFATDTGTVLERDGVVTVTVTLSAPTTHNVTVDYSLVGSATAGEDYETEAGPLVIPAGETEANIQITVIDDTERERTEVLDIALETPTGATLGGTLVHTLAFNDGALGDPIDGLTQAQLESFERGREVFNRKFGPSDGLGPFYNAVSCASCHSTPIPGGGSNLYRNFYLAVYQWGTLPSQQSTAIPPFLSQVVPAYGSGLLHEDTTFTFTGGRPLMNELIFDKYPVLSAQRNAIPVFGVGLFEFISDETIMSNADPFDTITPDGISGRINTQLNGAAVGRLGMKAQANNIELFTRGPLMNQMGITTDPFKGPDSIVSLARAPFQVSANPNSPTVDGDHVPDPELDPRDLGELVLFGRFIAPPQKKPFNDAAVRGEALFEDIGCVKCHIPSLPSSLGPVDAYTDLLIHDMGSELADNIRLGDVSAALTDFRTQPLWGISLFAPYLHDGRASTLRDAIELHAGEAQTIRNAYMALDPDEQADVIAFLEHL